MLYEHSEFCHGYLEPHVDYDRSVPGYRPIRRCACRQVSGRHGPAYEHHEDAARVARGERAQAKPIAPAAAIEGIVNRQRRHGPKPRPTGRAHRERPTSTQMETLAGLPIRYEDAHGNLKHSVHSCLRRGWAQKLDGMVEITPAGADLIEPRQEIAA